MKKFIEELKRRNVIKASLAYLVVSWIIVQVAQAVLPTFGAPDWVLKALIIGLAIGLPIWIIISWIYDITPEGIEKTAKDSGSELVTQGTNKRLNVFIIVSLSIAVIVMGLKLSNVFSSGSDKQYAIAVLPFDNMSADKENAWFCDGVTEDILTYLSRIKGLRVISRTSTERYKVTDKSIPEIAKELNVSYVVEGSVRKQGNKVLITAQLIDANDNHLWADNYNENLDDVFIIQQNVSKKIVQQLKIVISPEEEDVLYTVPTKNIEAYELFLKGRSIANLRGIDNLESSIKLYQKAIELDPNYADAIAELAWVYRLAWYFKWNWYSYSDYSKKKEVLQKVNNLLDMAEKINPNTIHIYTTKGMINVSEGNWEKAEENIKKAIELNPNDVTSHQLYSNYLTNKPEQEIKKALEQINIAYKLDPYSSIIILFKIRLLLSNDKLTEAEELYKDKSSFLSESFKRSLKNMFIETKTRITVFEKKDCTEGIKYYNNLIAEDSKNGFLYGRLSDIYNEVLNDGDNYLKYSKKTYELDSTNFKATEFYFNALIENKKFIKADKILQSNNIKQILDTWRGKILLFNYYYYQENYRKAQEILNDSLIPYPYYYFSTNFAQQSKVKEAYKILNMGVLKNWEKAIVFAILKERDSMYYYMNNEKYRPDIIKINSFNEMDPYRKEERYKEYLRKNYLPITHWNE